MASTLGGIDAADLQYVLNTVPLTTYVKAYVSRRDMIDMLGGFKPGPARLMPKFKYSNNSSAIDFAEGAADPSISITARRRIEFKYARYHAAFGVDGLQAAVAARGGVEDLTDLVMEEAAGAIEDLFDQINADILGSVSDNEIKGIQYHIADSGNYAEEAIDRSSATWLASYVADNSSVERALTKELLEAMQVVYFKTRAARPNAIWTGIEQFQKYENLFEDKKRITAKIGELQLETLTWDGIPIVPVPNYDANRMDFVQTQDWTLYYLPQVVQKPGSTSFMEGPFRVEYKPQSYDESKYVVYFYPQLICTNPYKQLALDDLED